MWGYNSLGQLGNGGTTNKTKPVKIMDDVKKISLGFSFSAAVKTDGSLWTWGQNWDYQLGNGGTTRESHSPIKIMEDTTDVSCGGLHCAAIKTDGSLWLWGSNSSGKIGNGQTDAVKSPIKIELETTEKIVSGFSIENNGEGVLAKDSHFSGMLQVSDNVEPSSVILQSEISAIKWTSSDQSIVQDSEILCTGVNAYDNRSAELLITFTPHKEGNDNRNNI